MSSFEELDYYMEAVGFENGAIFLIATILAVSLICGAVLAQCLLNYDAKNSETKQARKVLASVLNEGNKSDPTNSNNEDEMFDVPLSSEQLSYFGPAVENLTSETCYEKAPSRRSHKN